jgi:hypothetical protein
MPLQKLQFKPGINREGTNYANEGGWFDGNNVRFRSGSAEKIGGWVRYSPSQYLGVARALWNWEGLSGAFFLGVGTNLKYYISNTPGGLYNDVTPYLDPAGNTLTNPFSTTDGSPIVTVIDAAYNPNAGDYVTFTGATAVGGLTISGEYTVTAVVGANTYTITASSNATSNAGPGGGTVTAFYQYPTGAAAYTAGTGWSAGPWGGILSPVSTTLGTNPFTTNSTTIVTVAHTAHGFLTNATAFVKGVEYKIVSAGTTNFITLFGASSNAVGTVFIATNSGTGSSGTGTASIVYISISGATTVGGIPAENLNKTFAITYVNANSYTITSSTATSSTTGGGSAVVVTKQTGAQGWGTAASISNIGSQLRLWSNGNYGQDLVISPRGGPIYYWVAANGVNTRAQTLASLSAAPTYVPKTTNQVLASSIQQFIIALGSNSYVPGTPNTPFNPMLVRWSDQANPTNWVPEVTNQAGEFTLTNGSFIMAGRTTRQEILIWTNSCLYSMQYLGAPYVWGFNILMDNISVMSPNSMITINNVTYWMGVDKFYTYSGRVETLPCTLRQYVFADINLTQNYQVFAGGNEGYSEVWWFYCSLNSNVVDKYIIYNYLDRVWYYGSMGRTAWLDIGINQNPIAADYNRRILSHEVGTNDVSGETPVPIEAYIQSSDFDIGDGHNFGFVWRILPDVNFNNSTKANPAVTMTVLPRQNSGTAYGVGDTNAVISADNYTTNRVYTVQQFTGQVYTRIRGRQMSFRIASTETDVAWQLGVTRIDIRPDGRR